MAIWLPYKAKPHELKNHVKKAQQRQLYCRICGKPTNTGGHTCQSCKAFIDQMRKEERTGNHEHRRT